MKTTEQNTKEVMTYLEKSSKNFFQSEDGLHWQAVVKIQKTGDYVFVRNGEVFPIDISRYTGEKETAGKTYLKHKFHPQWDVNPNSPWYKGYGHGPSKKLRAVRWNLEKLELTSTAVKHLVENC
jgi:hypothetical protein